MKKIISLTIALLVLSSVTGHAQLTIVKEYTRETIWSAMSNGSHLDRVDESYVLYFGPASSNAYLPLGDDINTATKSMAQLMDWAHVMKPTERKVIEAGDGVTCIIAQAGLHTLSFDFSDIRQTASISERMLMDAFDALVGKVSGHE